MKTTRLILLAALLVLGATSSGGCTMIDKRIVFHPGSVINGIPGASERNADGSLASTRVVPSTTKDIPGEPGTREVVGPTGGASGEASGSQNFIMIVNHQDDGTEGSETTTTPDIDVSGLPQ